MTSLLFLLLAQATPGASAAPALPATAHKPCRMKDSRGKLVDVDPQACQAIVDYFNPPPPPPGTAYTGLEFEVLRSGVVENCRIVQSSGVASLDAKACALVTEKASFAPKPGKKMPERQTKKLRITWRTGR